jgi:murein DD-endopeptidase MepM/ murein hydrolase activator NlpD
MPDNDVGRSAFDFAAEARRDLRRINGNHVILDHGTGEYSLLCHLQHGSLAVRQGERVRQGQPLARLGNSGSTTHIHLHYELADGYDLRRSEGLPASFRRYRLLRGARATEVAAGLLDTGDIVESTAP